jgi:hypothetical protein
MYTMDFVVEFWKDIRDFADRRAKKRYEKVGSFISQCPNCQRHTYEMNSLRWTWVDKTAHLTCGSCDYVSYWKGDDLFKAETLVGGHMPTEAALRLSGQQPREPDLRVVS